MSAIVLFGISPMNSREDAVDLHGLTVDEALFVVKERLDKAKGLNRMFGYAIKK